MIDVTGHKIMVQEDTGSLKQVKATVKTRLAL